MVNKPKLIGISGCTNGGKTTLSKALIEAHQNALHFSQDDYYHSRDSDHLEFLEDVKLFNFDVITAIDMVKFHKELDKVIQSGKYEYIFVDGILLYEDEKLFNMLDKKYFINIDKEECFRRRQTRNYIIPDTQNYFEKYVWGAFERYKLRCEKSYSCITYLNGTDTVQSLFNHVTSELKALFMAEPISNTTPSISPCSSPSASLKSSTSSSPIPDSCPPTFDGECEFDEVAHRREILVD